MNQNELDFFKKFHQTSVANVKLIQIIFLYI